MTRRGIVVWRGQECGAASGGAEEICPAAMLDRLGLSEIDCLPTDRIGYLHSVTSSLKNHAFANDALVRLGANAHRSINTTKTFLAPTRREQASFSRKDAEALKSLQWNLAQTRLPSFWSLGKRFRGPGVPLHAPGKREPTRALQASVGARPGPGVHHPCWTAVAAAMRTPDGVSVPPPASRSTDRPIVSRSPDESVS